jgi:carbamoyl-phosphate synthase small subunit
MSGPSDTQNRAVLVLADGTVYVGQGIGAHGEVVAELCFNTAMTGYQEILTDPSYMNQIVAFTFPHIGNVGCNKEDQEQLHTNPEQSARGAVLRALPTQSSNYRSEQSLDEWMKGRALVGIAGIDTRALTKKIAQYGMPHAVLAYNQDGDYDLKSLEKRAKEWSGISGLDLAKKASILAQETYDLGLWAWNEEGTGGCTPTTTTKSHVVVMDFGIKQNILKALISVGLRVSIAPATSTFDDIMALKPDGVVLSNGPGDPAATGAYAVPVIQNLIKNNIPIFGICLGHQMLALALGAKTIKMDQGHHGANHPVKDLTTGKVEIVSMNHGFMVDQSSLPEGVIETHISLFDGSNCGIALKNKPVFSVQHHPEASPGPTDSLYLFERFALTLSKDLVKT